MRLLEVNTFPPPAPKDKTTAQPYAILSHVWEDEELTFANLHKPEHDLSVLAPRKISGAQRQAVKDGLDYIWIDTLCIDKSNPTELSEAINSMYRWYRDAEVCYVYLADLDGCPPLLDADFHHGGDTASKRYWNALFRESRWFSRGWTLQELIAPSKLRFYDRDWNLIGDLRDLASAVSEITGVHLSMLQHAQAPTEFSLAQRMCWAAGRETTRPEDRAYSLLGLLDMSIDIRYGEGSKAFTRLQEAIIERSADQSIFAWEKPLVKEEDVYVKQQRRDSYLWSDNEWTELLAPTPDVFAGANNIVPSSQPSLPYRMTNMGLWVTAQLETRDCRWIVLNCYDQEAPTKAILLNLRCNRVLTQQNRKITIGYVWLRPRALDQLLSPISRLSSMNGDEAKRLASEHEMYIAVSRALGGSKIIEQEYYNVWLRLLGTSKQPPLLLKASQPQMESGRDSYTWILDKQDKNLTPDLLISMSDSSENRIELSIAISHSQAFVRLGTCCCEGIDHQFHRNTTHSRAKILIREGPSLQNRVTFRLKPSLAIVASIRRGDFNGQQWHIVKVWTEERHAHFQPVKAGWRCMKGMLYSR